MSHTCCLFIGRFQPAHNGTLDALQQIVDAGYSSIVMGIGSSDKEYTPDNPLTYSERKNVLEAMMQEHFPTLQVGYAAIPDFNDNDARFHYIISNVKGFDAVASGNVRTKEIFTAQGYAVVDLAIRTIVKASNIRRSIKDNQRDEIKGLVPTSVIALLKEYGLTERLKLISPPEKKKICIAISIVHEGVQKNTLLNPEISLLQCVNELMNTSLSELPMSHVSNEVTDTENILTLHYTF